MMMNFPDTKKKLMSRISNYKSSMTKEKKKFGGISDGSGKRYLLFCMYFVLEDLTEVEKYIKWYKSEFPDDVGEPIQKLCWALSLFRLNNLDEARHMLAESMMLNLYLIPTILDYSVEPYDMWHSSSDGYIDYVNYLPVAVRNHIKPSEIEWMSNLYSSSEFTRIRNRYIEIFNELQNVKEVADRRKLLGEARSLLDNLD